MSVPALLLLLGAAVPLTALVLYPLFLLLVPPSRLRPTPSRHAPSGFSVVENDPRLAHDYRQAGFDVVARVEDSERPVLVFPGRRGRLTPGGLRRLTAPLSEPTTGLVVGRLLPPVIEEKRGRDTTGECVAVAEILHRGWLRYHSRREACLGTPASLHGAPFALRRELWAGSPGRSLARLARSGLRCRYLGGRRALVGRLHPAPDLSTLSRELSGETADELRADRAHFGIWLRRVLSLTPLMLALCAVGAIWGTIADGTLLYRLGVIAVAVPLIGALVGYQTHSLGFRSRVYFPLYWVALEVGLLCRALLVKKNSD